jgi:hypothetical protein
MLNLVWSLASVVPLDDGQHLLSGSEHHDLYRASEADSAVHDEQHSANSQS